jgi:4-aminobutyrate aminotransferase-like enzyme/Ser/Thr protein kinase RdoA (MazF antagonist)
VAVEKEQIKFLDRATPQLPEEDVRAMVLECFGISGDYRALLSERDQNYRITAADGSCSVVKISNVLDAEDIIDFQVRALRHIESRDSDLPVPRVIVHRNGKLYDTVTFPNGDRHIVHMLSYLQGVPMSETDAATSVTRRNLGMLMARVDLALHGFFHRAADHDHPWNIDKSSRFAPYTKFIADAADRKMVEDIFDYTARHVLPRVRGLRHQVIHHDAHNDNVLLDPDDPNHITGLIDFGDLTFGSIAAELAVACDSIRNTSTNQLDEMCDIVAGFDAALALTEDEVDLIYDLVLARIALTATIAAARLSLTPDEPAHIESAQPFLDRLKRLKDIGRRRAIQRLRTACRFPATCPRDPATALDEQREEELLAARKKLLGENATHFYARPVHFERSSGCFLYGVDGHAYLDCYNNVPQVGHCNPHVVKAIARQAAVLNTNTRYLYGSILEYAERLTGKLAPHLDACVFVNSGSEANDVAWQIAQLVTGNSGGLLMEDAYHGITEPIRAFSPGRPDKPLPDHLRGLLVPDPYRGPYRDPDPDLAARYAADAERCINELHSAGHRLAAFMIDSAFCSSGVPQVPDGYLRLVAEQVKAAGGLMICDEVQSGFGRMGQWWGHEHHGVRADIVTMGKPVGNGFPLGVVVTTKSILNEFIDKTHLFSTFGGNPVACAAGLAVLDVIERDDLIMHGVAVGNYLRDQIRELAKTQELIGDVRGHGMLAGVEFVSNRDTRTPATREVALLLELMRERHVLVGSEGRDSNILKLRPSLVFQRDNVDTFVSALESSLRALPERLRP